MTATTRTAGEILAEAAEVIGRNGWHRHALYDEQIAEIHDLLPEEAPVCAAGAIRVAAGGAPQWGSAASAQAEASFASHLLGHRLIEPLHDYDPVNTIGTWNDTRSTDEVVATLRAAAREEAAR